MVVTLERACATVDIVFLILSTRGLSESRIFVMWLRSPLSFSWTNFTMFSSCSRSLPSSIVAGFSGSFLCMHVYGAMSRGATSATRELNGAMSSGAESSMPSSFPVIVSKGFSVFSALAVAFLSAEAALSIAEKNIFPGVKILPIAPGILFAIVRSVFKYPSVAAASFVSEATWLPCAIASSAFPVASAAISSFDSRSSTVCMSFLFSFMSECSSSAHAVWYDSASSAAASQIAKLRIFGPSILISILLPFAVFLIKKVNIFN